MVSSTWMTDGLGQARSDLDCNFPRPPLCWRRRGVLPCKQQCLPRKQPFKSSSENSSGRKVVCGGNEICECSIGFRCRKALRGLTIFRSCDENDSKLICPAVVGTSGDLYTKYSKSN